jgi:hypothetical protein
LVDRRRRVVTALTIGPRIAVASADDREFEASLLAHVERDRSQIRGLDPSGACQALEVVGVLERP